MKIKIAHSPDSDDAFMFWAIDRDLVDTEGLEIELVQDDIESLNQAARAGTYHVTAISMHAYGHLAERYQLLDAGASFGDGYGPVVVARTPHSREDLAGEKVASPGVLTSARLALEIWQPEAEVVHCDFAEIFATVASGAVEAGVVIHEGQLTWESDGFHRVVDLGSWWREETGLPLPLGGNAVRKDLPKDLKQKLNRVVKASIERGLEEREEALDYSMQFARGLEADPERAGRFVSMYVNHWTLGLGSKGREAVQQFLDRGADQGILPQRVSVEVVGGDS